ncbi:MAG: hypothetical protein BHV69_07750 [Bacteroidales bacterium 52_46]|nr:MAG: hypothetical protein BHV69_07750 [Bacteroidales bacterium 52_46]
MASIFNVILLPSLVRCPHDDVLLSICHESVEVTVNVFEPPASLKFADVAEISNLEEDLACDMSIRIVLFPDLIENQSFRALSVLFASTVNVRLFPFLERRPHDAVPVSIRHGFDDVTVNVFEPPFELKFADDDEMLNLVVVLDLFLVLLPDSIGVVVGEASGIEAADCVIFIFISLFLEVIVRFVVSDLVELFLPALSCNVFPFLDTVTHESGLLFIDHSLSAITESFLFPPSSENSTFSADILN